jgi:hypothetical protein
MDGAKTAGSLVCVIYVDGANTDGSMLGLTDLNMRKRQNREADSQTEDKRKSESRVRLTSADKKMRESR